MSNEQQQTEQGLDGYPCPWPGCVREFNSEAGVKSHHQQTHGESIAGEVVECAYCGAQKTVPPSRAERGERHFCGPECQYEWLSETRRGDSHHLSKEKVGVECAWCGKEKTVYPSVNEYHERHFCDSDCQQTWRRKNLSGADAPRWDGGPVEVECEWCSESVGKEPSKVQANDRHFCGRECYGNWISENRIAEAHPHWEGGQRVREGIRSAIGPQPWEKAKENAISDGECELCGATQSKNGDCLAVHHIIPLMAGGTHAQELLMVLCHSCHKQVEEYTKRTLSEYLPDIRTA